MSDIWSYLASGPLLWLTITLAVHEGCRAVIRMYKLPSYVNPVLCSVAVVVLILRGSNTAYGTYFDGAQFLHVLLGPATVALAVPLHRNLHRVRQSLTPIVMSLGAGSLAAVSSAIGVSLLLQLPSEVVRSIAPKSATAPVAMGVSEQVGGLPSLTAVLVIVTGVLGASIATPLLNFCRVDNWRARGFALGLTSHGIGTARALECHPTAGAFASIGMGLNAFVTALLVPAVLTAVG